MSIPRVKPANWGIGEELSSAQINELDTNVTYALDKRAGETDTLESVVSCSGAGRIIDTVALGTDANTTYLVSGANSIIRLTSAITANRNYTLSATNAVSGDVIYIYAEPTFAYEITVKDQASADLYTVGGSRQWASFIYVGGWRLYQSGQAGGVRSHLVTAAGATSFTIPAGTSIIHGLIIGGGGGGGGGAAGGVLENDNSSGGGGGGGGGGARALAFRIDVSAIVGTDLTLTVAAGGTAGTASSTSLVAGSNGGDGGDSTITGTGISVTARGGQGGLGGLACGDGAQSYTHFGGPVRSGYQGTATAANFDWGVPGQGGYGMRFPTSAAATTHVRQNGQPSHAGAGGTRGTAGTSSGTTGSDSGGGGPGGGGGASEWASMVAGNGGDGGNSSAALGSGAAAGAAGTAGTLGAGGGGGGGGGGNGTGSAAAGGAGGAGGPGAILLLY